MIYVFKHKQLKRVELRIESGPEGFIGQSFEYQWSQFAHHEMRNMVKNPDDWKLDRTEER